MGESAPLLATAAAPVPAGGKAEWFTGVGGVRLRAALFQPEQTARGAVVVSPGRTEPIEKYFEVAEILTARGFVVLAHDWRGHGLSYRPSGDQRGHAVGWRNFIGDYSALMDTFEARLPTPRLALGHSMGGCLTLLALALGEARFAGAILSAPMLGLLTGAIPQPAARAMARCLTLLGLGRGLAVRDPPAPDTFETNVLTHDRARWTRNTDQIAAHPELVVGPPTWGWLDFAFQATDKLQRGPGVPAISMPLSVVAAGEDRLVDNAALERVTARVPGGRFLVASGAYHEILQETDALEAAFWTEFDLLSARAGVA